MSLKSYDGTCRVRSDRARIAAEQAENALEGIDLSGAKGAGTDHRWRSLKLAESKPANTIRALRFALADAHVIYGTAQTMYLVVTRFA
jgi:hypothetical protein